MGQNLVENALPVSLPKPSRGNRIPQEVKDKVDQLILAYASKEQPQDPNWTEMSKQLAKEGIIVSRFIIGIRAKQLNVESRRARQMARSRALAEELKNAKRPNIRALTRKHKLSQSVGDDIARKEKIKGYGKPAAPKKSAIRKLIKAGLTNQGIVEALASEFDSLTLTWVQTVRREKLQKGKHPTEKKEKKELTFDQRRVVLQSIAAGVSLRKIEKTGLLKSCNISHMARENWLSFRNKPEFDTTPFIAAAEALVAQQIPTIAKADLHDIMLRYFVSLSPGEFEAISAKYSLTTPREIILQSNLASLSDAELKMLITESYTLSMFAEQDSRFKTVPEQRAVDIIHLQLNCHPRHDIEPNAITAIKTFSLDEMREIMRESAQISTDIAIQGGWLQLLEGVRDWPSKPFLDGYVTHHFAKAEVTKRNDKHSRTRVQLEGPGHLQELTNEGYLGFNISAHAFQVGHFCFAARGVIFNRAKIRRQCKTGIEHAPSRAQIESMAPKFAANCCGTKSSLVAAHIK